MKKLDDETKVIEAIKKVGLYEKVKNQEKGIYTLVTKEFDKKAGKELDRYYLWYKNGKFLVILKCVETKTKKFFIATSFYVFDRNIEHYEELCKKGEKIC